MVEVRLHAGGMTPCALLGGQFADDDRSDVALAVGCSGDLVGGALPSCAGFLGRTFVPGLPTEFAQGAMNGLVRAESPLPPGRVEVIAGGYDDVDSSEFAFERAGGLLRLTLSRVAAGGSFDADALTEVLGQWHA
jgi:hypothetical protein